MLNRQFTQDVFSRLKARHGEASFSLEQSVDFEDEDALVLRERSLLLPTVSDLLTSYPFIVDICGVDYPEREKRFDVVYHFAEPKEKRRLRLKVPIAEGESLSSVTSLYKGANWFEREVYDLFGVVFDKHPDLRRILCHEGFVGHPLRKDYPSDKRQSLDIPVEHTFAKDRERLLGEDPDYLGEKVWINIGPAHPATHGTLRFMAVMAGETIEKLDIEIGYLHRCFEKMAETHNYNQLIPYTDRLNYCSAPLNNNVWCRTVEKLMKIQVPERAQVIRVILDEFSRIIDHFVCIITQILDLGALTNFWLGMKAREAVYTLFEKLCGARLTVSIARIGGLGFDLPKGWVEDAHGVCKIILDARAEIDSLVTKNRIFVNRMVGVTPISIKEAINWGFSGPCLRATGASYDLRVDQPYGGYENYDFDIPVGHTGDCYDRYMVRMEEIIQSVRIITQGLNNLPTGPITVDDPTVSYPEKKDVYGNIEGLMNQFMMVIHNVQPPKGEVYVPQEGANGELGFYLVSDGSNKPYRVKCRPPCFATFQGFTELLQGHMLADVIATLGTVNVIAGELDR